MSTPIRPSRRSAAAALAAALLAPAPAALANDRDLRGTPVPAAACVEFFRFGLSSEPWGLHLFRAVGANGQLKLRCPLPVSNVELSGAGNDNDISKFRVHYSDGDGFGDGASVEVILTRTSVGVGSITALNACFWSSNVDGTGATSPAKATKACAHDLAADTFYHFQVTLKSGPGAQAAFLGIDFPS